MLADANGLVEAVKKAAMDVQKSTKPVNVYFGEVISKSPLAINVEQKMLLGEKQLILTRNVTDYMTTVTVQWTAENSVPPDGETAAAPAHTHNIVGTKNFLMHNALEKGDRVILIRQQEGQKFIVVDRIGGIG